MTGSFRRMTSEHNLFPASRRQQQTWTLVWGPLAIVVTWTRRYIPR